MLVGNLICSLCNSQIFWTSSVLFITCGKTVWLNADFHWLNLCSATMQPTQGLEFCLCLKYSQTAGGALGGKIGGCNSALLIWIHLKFIFNIKFGLYKKILSNFIYFYLKHHNNILHYNLCSKEKPTVYFCMFWIAKNKKCFVS